MKLLLAFLLLTLICHEISAFDQLVAINFRPAPVTLKADKRGTWACVDSSGNSVTELCLPHKGACHANITLRNEDTYKCQFTSDGEDTPSATTSIRAQATPHLPLYQMCDTIVPELMKLQYNYLAMSHRYKSVKHYFPNVAKFFRNKVDVVAKMLDDIVTYILAKQITTTELDGSNPPYYIDSLFNGLSSPVTNLSMEHPSSLSVAFVNSFNWEKGIVKYLVEVGTKAEEIEDDQLEEFIFADLIPPLMKNMKELTNHKNTVEQAAAEPNAGLGEFMFDRLFS